MNTDKSTDWLFGKHVLITGAASGTGKEIAFGLLGKCKKMTLVSRNQNSSLKDVVRQLKNEIKSKDDSFSTLIDFVVMDIREYEKIPKLINKIYGNNEQIDVFINCAGGSHLYNTIENMSYEDINEIFDVNAKAPIFWLKEILAKMKSNTMTKSDVKRAHIILLSSRSGERTLPNLSIYTISKGAVEKLVETMRLEYAKDRIAFTLVNPGSIDTAFANRWENSTKNAHTDESMNVHEAAKIILQILDHRFVTNKISFESITQWLNEPGVLK